MNKFHLLSTLLLFILIPISVISQDYVDILKVGYGTTFNSTFENTPFNTDIKNFELGLTYPIVLNETHALITELILI